MEEATDKLDVVLNRIEGHDDSLVFKAIIEKMKRGETLTARERATLARIRRKRNAEKAPSESDRKQEMRRKQRAAIYAAREADREVEIDLGTVNKPRYNRCRKSLKAFLKTYLKTTFCKPWSEAHLTAITKIERAVRDGGLFAIAMPRGDGKSSLCKGAAIWAILGGYCRYIILIGATADKAKNLLGEIKIYLRHNDLLREDYPHLSCFLGQALTFRARSQTYQGKLTDISWKTDNIVMPSIDGCDYSGSLIEVAGIEGDILGRSHTLSDGTVIRPDFVIIDDPQTDESANSPTQTNKRERIIKADILGLAGPGRAITAVMPCTVKVAGDLSARFLDHDRNPVWQGETTSMIVRWPDNMELWDEYSAIFKDKSMDAPERTAKATEYYREHRAAMDQGAVLSWPKRGRLPGELSQLQNAMNLLNIHDRVHFMSEYQNQPEEADPALYEITPEIVANRVNHIARHTLPDDAPFLVVGTDVNLTGLHWVAAAFSNDLTGYIVDYGVWPGNGRELCAKNLEDGRSEEQAIYEGLMRLLTLLSGEIVWMRNETRILPDIALVDCGYSMDTVFRFAQRSTFSVPVWPSRGFASSKYRPAPRNKSIGQPGNNWDTREFTARGRVVAHNSDYWLAYMQKAFLLSPGSPGSLSLFGDNARIHRDIALQLACQKLIEYQAGATGDFYRWNWTPGSENHWADALVMAIIAANKCGGAIGGGKDRRRPRRRRPKPRVTYSE